MDRTGYIGSSDAGALLGVDPYRDRLDVWLAATGKVHDDSETKATARGKRLEDYCLDEYEYRQGTLLWRQPEQVAHPTRPWLRVRPDAYAIIDGDDDESDRWGVEAKTATGNVALDFGPEGTDEVPAKHLAQCHLCLAVTGLSQWDVVACVATGKVFEFRFYRIQADGEMSEILLAAADELWDYVQRDVPPPGRRPESRSTWLRHRFPGSTHPPLRTDAESVKDCLLRLKDAEDQHAAAALELDHAKLDVQEILGAHESLIVPEVGTVTWRSTKAGSRTFRTRWEANGS